jgi:hypothetical protein
VRSRGTGGVYTASHRFPFKYRPSRNPRRSMAETEQAAERLRQIPDAGPAGYDGCNNRRLDHANCGYSRCLDGGFVATIKVYRDFELRLKFRLRGENVNAGVQFRSERVPGSNEMIGYQADMGQHYWGCLYDERRHRLLAGTKGATETDSSRWLERLRDPRRRTARAVVAQRAENGRLHGARRDDSLRRASSGCKSTKAPRARHGTRTSCSKCSPTKRNRSEQSHVDPSGCCREPGPEQRDGCPRPAGRPSCVLRFVRLALVGPRSLDAGAAAAAVSRPAGRATDPRDIVHSGADRQGSMPSLANQ